MFDFPNYRVAACSEIRIALRRHAIIVADKIDFLAARLRGMPPALHSPSHDQS